MKKQIKVEIIGEIKSKVSEIVINSRKKLKDCAYIDTKIAIEEGKGAYAQNGNEKGSSEDYGFSFGVRVIAGKKAVSAGYYGRILGEGDLANLYKILQEGISHAYHRAIFNAKNKELIRKKYPALTENLYDINLAKVNVRKDTVPAQYKISPLSVNLNEIVLLTRDISKEASSFPEIKFNVVGAMTVLERELFVSSEGANIDQSFAITQGQSYVVAVTAKGNEALHNVIGHQAGWELVTNGLNEQFTKNPSLKTFVKTMAKDAIELANAPIMKTTDKEEVVVTDPNYNWLLVHEIVGHPSELDRALKMETGYAGRSWLFKNMEENMLGKQIASHLVTVFSDPNLPGYGHYKYDNEGTPAKRIVHIDKGIFKGFMNSRQTASILNAEPNGSYKANSAPMVPLIRMSNTVFEKGESKPEDIIKEVEHGYYLVGSKTPSIAESRENFRITANKVYEINKGKLGQLYRNGGIMADSKDFLMKIDAVGNDFKIYPCPNCGKGQPMQGKFVGNGGPTLRSKAIITGGQNDRN